MSQREGAHLREMVHEDTSWYVLYLLITWAQLTFRSLCLLMPDETDGKFLDLAGMTFGWMELTFHQVTRNISALHFWCCPLQLKPLRCLWFQKHSWCKFIWYCLFLYIFKTWFLIGRNVLNCKSVLTYVCLTYVTFPQKCYFTIFCSKCPTLHVTLESLLPFQSQLNFLWTIPSKGKSNIMFICVIPMFTLCVCVSTRLSQCFHLYWNVLYVLAWRYCCVIMSTDRQKREISSRWNVKHYMNLNKWLVYSQNFIEYPHCVSNNEHEWQMGV